jgi:hypothetical protein
MIRTNFLGGVMEKIYFKHIVNQLFEILFSNANYEIFMRKFFHSKMQYKFKDVIFVDDIYIQSISALFNKDLCYYLKNLEIIVKETDYKVISLKYDYFDKNENISNTNIQISRI